MDITIVNRDYVSGITGLYRLLWKRNLVRYYPIFIYLGMMLVFAIVFAILHDDIRGFSGGLIAVLSFFLLIYIAQIVRERKSYTVKTKELADRHAFNGNECTFRLTDHTFFYSSFELHQELRWHTFKSATVDANWIILEGDYGIFGIRQSLLSDEQRNQIIGLLKEKIVTVKISI